jgi:hypothetical protein
MPAPQADAMKQFARAQFMSFNIRVPDGWQDPSGDPQASHYGKAFKPSEKSSSPGAPPLFTPASLNKYHTDTQKMLIAKFGAFIDGTCTALCSAWSQWQQMATMTALVATGPTVVGGLLTPVPMLPLILAGNPPMNTENEIKYTTAIAQTISQQWTLLAATIIISSPFPSHPPLAAFPSPAIPPPGIPNVVPIPMATACTAMADPLVSADVMKPLMMTALGDPKAQYAEKLFDAICTGFYQCYQIWKKATLFNQVCVSGAVPTWTPVSPAGPVVGIGMMMPGGMT